VLLKETELKGVDWIDVAQAGSGGGNEPWGFYKLRGIS
jgi:hypothetical protein